jgi:hypothetical protein
MEVMTDQLYLSIWLERTARAKRKKHFETLLRLFPFSQREQGQLTVSVLAIDPTEPPLLERPMNGPADIEEILQMFNDYKGEDVAYRVDSFWDLWRFDGTDWALAPNRVALFCLGSGFDDTGGTEEHEDLRIEFGVDSNYLPQPDFPGSTRLVESNIRSLLRLVHELDSTLPVAKRKLETESGENFADRLQQAISGTTVH